MNPYTSDLESLFKVYGNANPFAYTEAMGRMDLGKLYADQQMRQLQMQNDQSEQGFPEKQRGVRLGNDTTEAMLPGVRADSMLKTHKAGLSYATLDKQLEELMRSYESKFTQQDYQEMMQAGDMYAQAGAALGALPVPARHAAAKQMLGKYYRPEFDQYSGSDLEDTLSTMGKWMMNAKPKLYGDLIKQDDKQAFTAAENAKKLQAQKELAAFRAALSERLAKLKQSQDPKTYEAVIVQLKQAAAAEQDPERRQALLEQAQEFANLQFAMRAASAQAGQAGKVDVPGMADLPSVPQPTPPSVGGGVNPMQNNPAMADPNLSKLPPGTKALGNGIYMLPDGRKIKANK